MSGIQTPPRVRAPRSDGEQSRERLLQAALRLFSEHGYTKTSTRAIAEAAQTNVAAIRYYFGDKAGLYRCAYFEPFGSPEADMARYADPAMSLADALRGLYATFLEPLAQGEAVRLSMKLRYREMLEHTGLLSDEIHESIKPQFAALLALMCRHVGVKKPDDDIRRLAMSVAALGVNLFVMEDVSDQIAPTLKTAPRAMDLWSDRLVMFGEAMVLAEVRRRAEDAASTPVKAKKK
jgi:TetR/AcrR family transcriptional regulator, regulator of cefoperazone and chloramphenicol sensitivity